MPKATIQTLLEKKTAHQQISMLAVSDFPFAKLAEEANIDVLLVGDSIGMTVYGFSSLLPVTMDLMVPHTQAVRKGAPNTFLIGDLPFLTYEITIPDAIRNAGRFMAECGCDAVKLEGGQTRTETIKALVNSSIPVVGHIGFTPQAMTLLGGFKSPGQDVNAALRIVEDAKALEAAGICMLVLEAVPAEIASHIAKSVKVPVIGFGSGPKLDGQILLLHDLLGLFESFTKKFAKRYLDLSGDIKKAVGEFINDIENGKFPDEKNFDHMPAEVNQAFQQAVNAVK
jgi:3-methyl-2-oxobutanoate hydroxymethyltransferase